METALRPITKEERLRFTLKVEIERMIDEILSNLFFEEKYSGVVEIWPVFQHQKNGELKVQMEFSKISNTASKRKNKSSIRYHIAPEKGVKLLD